MTIKFSVYGNPAYETNDGYVEENPKANPIPKLKMTGKQHWTDKAKRYVAWKEHVTNAFFQALADDTGIYKPPEEIRAFVDEFAEVKPIETPKGQKIRMDIVIKWSSERRGDPENIFGSIADALFEQDKYLVGSFDYVEEKAERGEVEITITI